MTDEEIVLSQMEEYDFTFTPAELELVHKANIKPLRNGLVLMGIVFVLALMLLWWDLLGALSGGMLLGMMFFGCVGNLLSISNAKKKFAGDSDPVLRCRYHYQVSHDHVVLTVHRDQTQIVFLRIEYSELKTVLDAESHYIYAYNHGAYLIPKAALQPDSPFAAALRDKVAPKKPTGKGYHVLAAVFLWATILGLLAPTLLTRWIPGLAEDHFGQAKLLLAILPLPILSLSLGIALRKKGIKWKPNVIIGAIAAMVILMFAGLSFLGGVVEMFDFGHQGDSTYLEQVEDTLCFDIPQLEDISNYEHEPNESYAMNGQLRYTCFGWVPDAQIPAFTQQVESDGRWINRVPTTLQGLMPPGTYLYQGEWILLYNMDTAQYNQAPAQSGVYHFLLVEYDPEYGDLSFTEYNIEYIP